MRSLCCHPVVMKNKAFAVRNKAKIKRNVAITGSGWENGFKMYSRTHVIIR